MANAYQSQQQAYDEWIRNGGQPGNYMTDGPYLVNGQTYYTPPPQQGPQPGPQQPPPASQQIGQFTGQVGGTAAGSAAANQISGLFSAPPPIVDPATVSTSASGSSAASAASSGYPMTEAVLQGGDVATATTPGTTAPTWFASIAPALQWAGVLGIGAYTGMAGLDAYKEGEHKGWGGGLKEGIESAGALNAVPVLGQVPWLAGAISGGLGGKKHKDQYARDAIRGELVKTNFLNPDFTFTLPNGSTFDFGKDGNATLQNEGVNPLSGKSDRGYYDVDWSKPDVGGIVAAVNPLAAAFARGDKKLTEHFAGYLTNAALSGGDPRENIGFMIQKAGLDHDKLYGLVHLLSKSQGGELDDKIADAYKNGLDQLYGVGAYKGKGGQFGTPDIKPGDAIHTTDQSVKPVDVKTPQVTNPPDGSAQQPTDRNGGRRSPFIGSALNARFGPQRISPGIWQDEKGTYKSKTGARGG